MKKLSREQLAGHVERALDRMLGPAWSVEKTDDTRWRVIAPQGWLDTHAPDDVSYDVHAYDDAVVVTHGNSDAGARDPLFGATWIPIWFEVHAERLDSYLKTVFATRPPNRHGFT